MIDGIRKEQVSLTKDYQEYIRRMLWKCNLEWHNVLPIIFREHTHQARMTKQVLEQVETPMILFVEHDAPITPDNHIDWDGLKNAVRSGEFNVIRLHHEALILEGSKHLMFDEPEKPYKFGNVPLIRTSEWSQRPHLALTAFYKRIMNDYFSPNSKTMIEDAIYGKVMNDCKENGMSGWYNWRVAIYHPEGHIKRSYHLDARGNQPKYDMEF
jgi:hypothetical protein